MIRYSQVILIALIDFNIETQLIVNQSEAKPMSEMITI